MVSCKGVKNSYVLAYFMLSNYLYATSYAQSGNNAGEPEVSIPQGNLRGTTIETLNGRNVSAFLAIPYAQPPTGDLRFANPVAATGWNGTRDAGVDGSRCLQSPGGTVIGDEDCLHLNVYTPQLPGNSSASLLPVMVFVHGGGFTQWSSVSTMFGPEYILDEDVLLVTMNYRLGPLGFLSTGDEVAPGNWGLKDQVLALQWVRDNVEHFGGDPSQVTLFGQSAGAVSVHLLALSNATIGLFHRYITQSGSALATWAHRSRTGYARVAAEFAESLGCSGETTDASIACLRTLEGSEIIAAASLFNLIWSPTDEPDTEGAVLTDTPANLFARGEIRDLPWICGVTRDEGLLFTIALYEDDEAFANFLDNFDSALASLLNYEDKSDGGAAWIEAVKTYYFDNDLTAEKSSTLASLTNLAGDSSFFYPAYSALRQQHALAANPQYFYSFNYRGIYSFTYADSGSTTDYGVSHSDDLVYLFTMRDSFGNLTETLGETDYEMIDVLVKLWTSFAVNGTPSVSLSASDSVATWQPYSTAEDNHLRIGNESDAKLGVEYSFLKERMQFWADLDNANATDDSGSATSTRTPNSLFVLLLLICSRYLFVSSDG